MGGASCHVCELTIGRVVLERHDLRANRPSGGESTGGRLVYGANTPVTHEQCQLRIGNRKFHELMSQKVNSGLLGLKKINILCSQEA